MVNDRAHVTPVAAELCYYVAVCVVKDLSALRLALKYRTGALQAVFLRSAVFDLAGAAPLLYFTPAYTGLPGLPGTQGLFVVLAAANLYGFVKVFLQAGNIRAEFDRSTAARGRAAERTAWSSVQSLASQAVFVAAQATPSYFLAANCAAVALGGGAARDWMFDIMPALQDNSYDVMLLGFFMGNLGLFTVTLRDRIITPTMHISVLVSQLAIFMGYFSATIYLRADGAGVLYLSSPQMLLDFSRPW